MHFPLFNVTDQSSNSYVSHVIMLTPDQISGVLKIPVIFPIQMLESGVIQISRTSGKVRFNFFVHFVYSKAFY